MAMRFGETDGTTSENRSGWPARSRTILPAGSFQPNESSRLRPPANRRPGSRSSYRPSSGRASLVHRDRRQRIELDCYEFLAVDRHSERASKRDVTEERFGWVRRFGSARSNWTNASPIRAACRPKPGLPTASGNLPARDLAGDPLTRQERSETGVRVGHLDEDHAVELWSAVIFVVSATSSMDGWSTWPGESERSQPAWPECRSLQRGTGRFARGARER